jgi:GH25 family lysozyme M1 (1,4-beta-N-acetylmuramidase)
MKAIIISALMVGFSQCYSHAIDYSTLLTVDELKCMRNNGMSLALPRAWRSSGTIDTNAVQNIKNAHDAGFPGVDVYLFPCRGKSAADQVNQMINELGNSQYGTIWMDVETNPSSSCSWANFSPASNCDYVG